MEPIYAVTKFTHPASTTLTLISNHSDGGTLWPGSPRIENGRNGATIVLDMVAKFRMTVYLFVRQGCRSTRWSSFSTATYDNNHNCMELRISLVYYRNPRLVKCLHESLPNIRDQE